MQRAPGFFWITKINAKSHKKREAGHGLRILSSLALVFYLSNHIEKLLQNGKVKENFYEAVLEREREYPTGLKFEKWEVAIPHVSPEYVLESTIAIAVLDEPVEFKRMDDESSVHVNVVFNIALGKDGKQIEILQDIMAIFADSEKMERIVKAESPEQVISIIKG